MEELFWADQIARKIVGRNPDKSVYFMEGGIAPSARKHIGSIREITIGYFVKLALERLGKKVRFAYSWDAYDRLKKISASIPEEKRRALEKYIGAPQGIIPDPFGCHTSYGEHFEKIVEEEVKQLGISPEFLYQDKLYKKGIYAELIKQVMLKRDIIRNILNKYRSEELSKDWWPVRAYCEECGNGDDTEILEYDGEYVIKYKCNKCNKTFTTNFKKNGIVKPTWRVDWAMRWHYYDVDFEPSGKDHMVAGSSYDTSSEIVRRVFGTEPPYAIIYEFVGKRGETGKMSASKGNIVTLTEVLEVYLPEVVRYLFAGTKPAKLFSIPFSDEIFKIYEDFYAAERTYFGLEKNMSERGLKHWSRVYEFTYLLKPPKKMPVQPPFKHCVELINIYGNPEKALNSVKEKLSKDNKKRYLYMLSCAKNWAEKYGREHLFMLVEKPTAKLSANQKKVVKDFLKFLENDYTEKELIESFAEIAQKNEISINEFFSTIYTVLFNKERGPRLVHFISAVGKKKVIEILKKV